MTDIILASASPRRKELLGLLPINFKIITKSTSETMDSNLTPIDNVIQIAKQKSEAVAREYRECLVIGCDTIVVLGEQILGKPHDEDAAYNMLKDLSGEIHKVYTGVSIKGYSSKIDISFYEETKVFVKKLTDKEIWTYIHTKDPMDKAGSYGIQTGGSLFIEKIEGDYFNVVGLPVSKLYDQLKQLGIISL